MLPASGITRTVHRPPVLCQEGLTLAIRQDGEDALRIERILLPQVGGQRAHICILARLLARHPHRRAKAALAAQSVDVVRNLHAAIVPRPRAPWH